MKIKDNKGASLITVIITMGFLAVLASILISAVVMNYQMKHLDARNKKDFYTVETALDDVYNGLGRDMTIAIGESYELALTKADVGSIYDHEDAVYEEFVNQFHTKFLDVFGITDNIYVEINQEANRQALCEALSDYIVEPSGDEAIVASMKEVYVSDDKRTISLKGTVITYNNNTTNTTSSITTDIVLTVPTVRFFTSHEYIWDYAIIGNKGVTVTSNSGSDINGNLFAGTTDNSATGDGGLTLDETTFNFNGEMLVTSGDILNDASTMNVQGLAGTTKANIWARSIMVDDTNSNLYIYASTFLCDDLQIDGTNSTLVLSGELYAYSNNTSTTGVQHTSSSSIIVNGSGTIMDLTGLNLLIVAGRSYIDFNTTGYLGTGDASNDEYGTGEGLALKTNQFIYLVPINFLNTTNPVQYTSSLPTFDATQPEFLAWYGYQYLDSSEPVIKRTITYAGGDRFTYYFLNFKKDANGSTEQMAAAYANRILEDANWVTNDTNDTLDERAGNLLAADLNLTDCTVYSNFAIMSYDEASESVGKVELSSNSIVSANKYAGVLGERYTYIWCSLDPVNEVALDEAIKDVDLSLTLRSEAPLANYLKLTVSEKVEKTLAESGYEVKIFQGDTTISDSTKYQGVIYVDGDVTLDGVNIEGIVMARGTVTLENGATVTANREIVKTIIEEELKETIEAGIGSGHDDYDQYFISYLVDPTFNGDDVYGSDVVGTDYSQFISYENWKKG